MISLTGPEFSPVTLVCGHAGGPMHGPAKHEQRSRQHKQACPVSYARPSVSSFQYSFMIHCELPVIRTQSTHLTQSAVLLKIDIRGIIVIST